MSDRDECTTELEAMLLGLGHEGPFLTGNEVQEQYKIEQFGGPGVCAVQRRSDGKVGSLLFADSEAVRRVLGLPEVGGYSRVYFGFKEHV